MKASKYFNQIFFCVLLFFSITSYAQITTVNTYKNLIATKESRGDLQGSPYLFPEWEAATVKFSMGINPLKENVKYDLLEDVLVTKGENDQEYTFKDMPTEFILSNTKEVYRNGFKPVDGMSIKTFYNVIYDGKVKYLKKLSKTIIESKGYNSATVTKKVTDMTNYYLVINDSAPVKVKNNEKSFITVLGKGDELTKFIKENKIDLKTNEGVIKFLSYYDTL
ncbi:hypothetical protein [Pedobacter sp. Leaf176]|uniref:hypothetical protein n=1 Tax=Pedobacter sp. Leaf176 TaxID=1736286 RepID=UPI0006F8AD5D|nr:hypothetical protein [Pedobacter sp. Leaf176]KQR71810.1 hypothetical protein ASF92_00390 [Pedobacter sp. Leaf176]